MSSRNLPALNYPFLSRVYEHIAKKSPFQKNAIGKILEKANQPYLDWTEDLIRRLGCCLGDGDQSEKLADYYLQYTELIKIEEMHFYKESKYRQSDFAEVERQVYSRNEHMQMYVCGLGLTLVFWPGHYGVFQFFQKEFLPLIRNLRTAAEVGLGHGIYQTELLKAAPEVRSILIDISPMALKMTKKLIDVTGLDIHRVQCLQCDIQKGIPLPDSGIDILLLGEIIEHLQTPSPVLKALTKKMTANGFCFLSTAANAPAEDHILLFKNRQEIRNLISQSGWIVFKEHSSSLDGIEVEDAEVHGHPINYAAVLRVAQ